MYGRLIRAAAIFSVLVISGGCAGEIAAARPPTARDDLTAWRTSGGDWGQIYYSPLDLINTANVGALGYAWSYDLATTLGLEATPVVVAGVMYASAPWGFVHAVDARTGKRLWRFDPHVDTSIASKVCCGVVNRGLAVAQDRVFVASTDGRLFTLDAKTGKVLWQSDTIIDHSRGYSVTGGVFLTRDSVIIGNSGADLDARGYVSAYAIQDGRLRWRFFTVPASAQGPFENSELKAAVRTWDAHSRWEVGLGGTVWDGMAYDPKLNLIYFGTGNAQMLNQKLRSPSGGDNLFVCSLIALHADTGRMAWYYQEVPGDQWDYDAVAPIILADLTIRGHAREVLMQAPKDGFFYVLDRASGALLSAEPYVPVTWARRVDKASGRPVLTEQADYSRQPRLVFPSTAGGHLWQPMAFNPTTKLVYIPTIDAGDVFWMPEHPFVYERGAYNRYVLREWPTLSDGQLSLRSTEAKGLPPLSELARGQPDPTIRGFLRAWDPVANRVSWQVETSDRWAGQTNAMGNGGGVITTAGGLVFQGRSTGYLHVYRAEDGRSLAEIKIGTSIMAAPMTYELDGVQYVAVMAGLGGVLGADAEGTAAYQYGNQGRIVTLRLGGGPVPVPPEVSHAAAFPRPPVERFGAPELIERGNELFKRHCNHCHLNQSATGVVPDLRRMTAQTHAEFEDIVLRGARASKGMGSFAQILGQDDVNAIHAAIVDAAWREYEREDPVPHSGASSGH
jgi:quinohemoprotein ethanol dehydrogenase